MKIKLVIPPRSFIKDNTRPIPIPPLSIAHLASFIKKEGYEVELDDLDIKVISDNKLFDKLLELQKKYNHDDLKNYLLNQINNDCLEEISNLLLKKIEYEGYNVFGFTLIESSSIDFALLISKRIKEETGCSIVFGGPCANPALKRTYNFVDYVICGPGEVKLLNILQQIENKPLKKDLSYHSLDLIPDFTGLPFSCYRNMQEGSQFSNYGKILILPYIWACGCPYRCSFCGNSLGKVKVYFKPVNQAITELKKLSEQYNTRYFFILNEYIHVGAEYTRELYTEMINRNLDIAWCGSARCDIDINLLPRLHEAGCCYIFFGFESGSNNILKKMRKGYTEEVAEKTVRETHRTGIWINLGVIVGFPQEKEEDFRQSFDFINRNQEYIDQLAVSPYYFVNSEVMQEPEKFGIEIIESVGMDKNSSRDKLSYNEINGPKWLEVEKIKNKRLQKLLKLFYLHKSIPELFLRDSTHDLMYALDKFKNKQKTREFIKKLHHSKKSREEFVLNITSLSNDNCLICEKPKETFETLEEINKKIMDLKKKGVKKIVIAGGEPTIISSIFDIIKELVKEGFEIKLRTNARMLHYRDFCVKLQNAGLEVISVPLYSHKPDKHDAVTRVKGSFDQTIVGIENWKQIGGGVEIETIVSEYNNEDMYEFVDFILDKETIHVF